MIRESVTLDDVIQYLNELIEIDRPAMAALFANRVPCNEALADHPTVQVRRQHGGYHVGQVGILNGLFGVSEDGIGPLCIVFDDQGPVRYNNLICVARTPTGAQNDVT